MNFIAALNDAGTACLLAESEVAMQRMMGGFGRRMRNATEAHEAALKRLFETLRAAGIQSPPWKLCVMNTAIRPLFTAYWKY